MVNITINSVAYTVADGLTVIQACEVAGIEIPRFCYHERLAIAGNCRMCLVEIEGPGAAKPVASCAMPVSEGMKIKTDSEKAKRARFGTMEFLLINHPLDCPICDQGGECDLQDQAMKYGKGISRFTEEKRAVPSKSFGPLIKTDMTRCIHCTRCIRFISDVAGSYELGAVYRGEKMEIDTFLGRPVKSELSGNIIDLCPVGALTSKPYRFKARPWELSHCESIDIMDAVGSAIRVDSKGNEVMRILPRLNESVNEEWISDIARFAYDGLKYERIDRPYIKMAGGHLVECSWDDAIKKISSRLLDTKPANIAALAGKLSDCESMFLLKKIFNHLGSTNLECRFDNAKFDVNNRISYLFNSTISGIDKADTCLIIGCNPRKDAPVLNARIRKNYLTGKLKIAYIGEKTNLNFNCTNLGKSPSDLRDILSGKSSFCELLLASKTPMMIIGQDPLSRSDALGILSICYKIAEKFGYIRDDWNGFNVLQRYASRVGALDLGFFTENEFKKNASFLYIHELEELDFAPKADAFIVYHGHHGCELARTADVILPGAAYTEKDATYANTEGRYQRASRAVFPPGSAKEDWQALLMLANALGINFGYRSISDISLDMESVLGFGDLGLIKLAHYNGNTLDDLCEEGLKFSLQKKSVYLGNSICKASRTMLQCKEAFEDDTNA